MSAGRLVELGLAGPDGLLADLAARDAAEAADRLVQQRRDARNAKRRARRKARAEGVGTRPAGDTAPVPVTPWAPAEPDDGLRFCDRCLKRETPEVWARHQFGIRGVVLVPMVDDDEPARRGLLDVGF